MSKKIKMLATSWLGKTYWAGELYLIDCSLAQHFLDKKIAIEEPDDESGIKKQIDKSKRGRKPKC